MENEPKIVTSWDSMPPVVYAEGRCYSTRVLAMKYREMEEAIEKQKQERVQIQIALKNIAELLKLVAG